MIVTFYGAARTVTGSKHLLTLDNGKKILLDCGFFQGHGTETDGMNRHFGFSPSEIDAVILSHAHIDHSGNIPNLVKQGFKGKIYCTPATYDLCCIMLADTAHIQENDAKYLNKRRKKQGQSLLKPIYRIADVENALTHFEMVEYKQTKVIFENVSFEFTNSGHILGAAAINLQVKENETTKRLCFTGDIGRPQDKILKSPEPFPQADYIICESTYGNRLHDPVEVTEGRLLEVVQNTCVEKKGKLVIPAFSLGRTQEIVYALNNLSNQGKLPRIKVYVDSPLSVNATNIMRKHPESFNAEITKTLKEDPDPFGFNSLQYIQDVEISKTLNELREPCIIISASGMAEAGRIKHHIKNTISDARNTILIVGYCTPGSLGGRLMAGSEMIRIFGDEYPVKASVEIMNSFSAHADYKEMISYLGCQDAANVKKIFLVHGEYDVQIDWREKLHEQGFRSIEIPDMESSFEIN